MSKKFFLTSRHGCVGSAVMFHAKNGRGYTSNLDNAHQFDLEEAQKEVDQTKKDRDGQKALEVNKVLAKAVLRVDMQLLRECKDRARLSVMSELKNKGEDLNKIEYIDLTSVCKKKK